jgi:hypothetical protein
MRAPLGKHMHAPEGSSRNVRHEEPIGHTLLEVPDHRCFAFYDAQLTEFARGWAWTKGYLRFEPFDECGEIRREGRCERIVLVPQRSPNCGERNVAVERGIHIAWRGERDDTPTYPVVDPVSCGGEMAHGPLLTSPPPVPRQLSNARTVGLVPDKGNCSWHPSGPARKSPAAGGA